MNQEKSGPRFFYGWVIVAASLAVIAVSVGITQSFGIFFKPLISEFGWSRAQVSLAFSLSFLSQGVFALGAGALSDRYGPKRVLVVSGLIFALGNILMFGVHALWQFYLVYGLIHGMGRSGHYSTVVSTVPRWFTEKRGLALGIMLSGGGVGNTLFPPLSQYLITAFGWRLAFVLVGLIAGVVIVAAAQFIKYSPREAGLVPYGEAAVPEPTAVGVGLPETGGGGASGLSFRGALSTRALWLVLVAGILSNVAIQMTYVHLVAHATDVGLSAAFAASLFIIIGGFNIVGKLSMGIFSDRFGRKAALVICFGLGAMAMLWLTQARTPWMFYAFATGFGFAYAGWIPQFPALMGDLFGLGSLGALVGAVSLANTLGSSTGAYLGGYIFDVRGSYDLAFVITAAGLIVGVALILSVRAPRDTLYRGAV
ncbi:MAG: MFS transporter [Dehalococcoidia bacterium]